MWRRPPTAGNPAQHLLSAPASHKPPATNFYSGSLNVAELQPTMYVFKPFEQCERLGLERKEHFGQHFDANSQTIFLLHLLDDHFV